MMCEIFSACVQCRLAELPHIFFHMPFGALTLRVSDLSLHIRNLAPGFSTSFAMKLSHQSATPEAELRVASGVSLPQARSCYFRAEGSALGPVLRGWNASFVSTQAEHQSVSCQGPCRTPSMRTGAEQTSRRSCIGITVFHVLLSAGYSDGWSCRLPCNQMRSRRRGQLLSLFVLIVDIVRTIFDAQRRCDSPFTSVVFRTCTP